MVSISAQNIQNNPGSNHGNRFEQLGTILPTPIITELHLVHLTMNIGNSVQIMTFLLI
jgi:hypothetical protein